MFRYTRAMRVIQLARHGMMLLVAISIMSLGSLAPFVHNQLKNRDENKIDMGDECNIKV